MSPSLVLRNALMAQANPSLFERLLQPYLINYQQEPKERRYSLPLAPKILVTGGIVYPELHVPLEFFSLEAHLKLLTSFEERLFALTSPDKPGCEEDSKKVTSIASYAVLDFISLSCHLAPFR
jgi:hypothetical protein